MIKILFVYFMTIFTLYGNESTFDAQKAQTFTYTVEVITNNDEHYSGTAVALSNDGKLISAFHVIDDYKSIKIIANNGKEYNATVGKVSIKNDLVFLHINAKNIPYVDISYKKRLGESVYILSYDNLLLKANIAQIKPTAIMLNIDTKPGTSGGGVFNKNNKLIGILLREDILHNTSFAASMDQLNTIVEPYRVNIDKKSISLTKNYDTTYCHDKNDLAIWNKLANSPNLKVQELHALFLGLCMKVEKHNLTTDQAQLIFETSKERLLRQ